MYDFCNHDLHTSKNIYFILFYTYLVLSLANKFILQGITKEVINP